MQRGESKGLELDKLYRCGKPNEGLTGVSDLTSLSTLVQSNQSVDLIVQQLLYVLLLF